MVNYKDIRYQFQKDIKNGTCTCILSGLPITDQKQLSLEHYMPLSRVRYGFAAQDSNIFPAYKLINNIKGNRTPCEWKKEREFLMNKTLNKAHLDKNNTTILKAAIENIPNYNFDPCQYCILSCGLQNTR